MPPLRRLIEGLEVLHCSGDLDIDIGGVQYDSRQVRPGDLFVCIPGFTTDGHRFAPAAAAAGARAFLVQEAVDVAPGLTVVTVADTRRALPRVASAFFSAPSRGLTVIGVTGTNGKTTTTHLIAAVLEAAGKRVGLMGTLYARWRGVEQGMAHTTPESLDIQRFMRQVLDDGGSHVVMEVSSHALDLGRVDCIDFDCAVFTNLTQDHLDYHGDMGAYLRAKLGLFARLPRRPGACAVVNGDDPAAGDFMAAAPGRCIVYGLGAGCEVRAEEVVHSLRGSRFALVHPGGRLPVSLRLAGLFNVYNALAAAAAGIGLGLDQEVIRRGLESVTGVPGRFETVDAGQDFTVIVDYAHTPDGLANVLRAARGLGGGRLITVFGCGGDRDRGKRPLMGAIAAAHSDLCVVTSDNPRSEEPEAIIADIVAGIAPGARGEVRVESDRRRAIQLALEAARAGDVVVIAGKGHETYQLVKGQSFPFDDRAVARELLGGKQHA